MPQPMTPTYSGEQATEKVRHARTGLPQLIADDIVGKTLRLFWSRTGSRFSAGPATSFRRHCGAPGGKGLAALQRQGEMKDGAARFIRGHAQLSLVCLDDRTANRHPHAHAAGLGREECLEAVC